MEFTDDETRKLKALILFLVEKKSKISGGKCGFHITELQPILDKMVIEGTIIQRDTIHNYQFFINTKN